MFQVADQVDAAIVGSAHPQTDGHFSIFGDDRVDVQDLHAAGQHSFQIHHDGGPGEGLTGKDPVEKL